MSENSVPDPGELKEKTVQELKELAAGWRQTLDAIEDELSKKANSEFEETLEALDEASKDNPTKSQ